MKRDSPDHSTSRPTRRQLLGAALLLPGLAGCSPKQASSAQGTGPAVHRTPGGPSGTPVPTSSQPVTAVASPTGGVLNIVAHPDDDLLFLSPALLASLQAGTPVRTVYLTAGDDGKDQSYWQGREAGIRSAYAKMLDVEDLWHAGPPDTPVPSSVLTAAPQVTLQFTRLPDGGPGNGFPRYGGQSLPRLWRGQQPTIRAVDGSAQYTRSSLIEMLLTVMAGTRPQTIRTQDFHGHFNDGDHNDHHAAAYLTQTASQRFSGAHWLEAYQDYSISGRRVDVFGTQLRDKQSAFAKYAAHDSKVCTGYISRCAFTSWEQRQYRESRTWSAES